MLIKIEENSVQGKAFAQYVRTLAYVEVVEEDMPSYETQNAINELETTKTEKHKDVKNALAALKK